MPVLPGAEPFRHEGGEVGVLLCHGFTGSPQSLRPWAEYLAEHGLTVSLPLLPGHGTRWEDLQITGWQDWYAEVDRELRALRERCAQVFVFGLSMGGALALRLAAKHGDAVSGVVVVNPANKVHGLAGARPAGGPPSRPHDEGASRATSPRRAPTEVGYDRVPLHAAHSLRSFFRLVDARAAAGHPAAAGAAQPAGPCRAAGRLGARSSAGSRRRTSTEIAAGTELPRRDVGPRRGADLRGELRASSAGSRPVSARKRTRLRSGTAAEWRSGAPRGPARPADEQAAWPTTWRGTRWAADRRRGTARSRRTRRAPSRSSRSRTWRCRSPGRTSRRRHGRDRHGRDARPDEPATSTEPATQDGTPLGSSVSFAPGVGGPATELPRSRPDDDFDEDDEGHFVPPEPPPLPEADVTAKFAWLAVIGGPVLLLLAVLLRLGHDVVARRRSASAASSAASPPW